jgi:hypothetical protein
MGQCVHMTWMTSLPAKENRNFLEKIPEYILAKKKKILEIFAFSI